MNARRAKQIRKLVYGNTFSPRYRKYFRTDQGNIISDDRRRRYQAIKKDIKNWLTELKEA